jgi:hypothetical protein
MRRLKHSQIGRLSAAPASASAPSATAGGESGHAGAELKDAGILEEEVALFRKEQTESSQVDLLLVGLDLREVGVDREVPDQSAGDAILHVDAGVHVAGRRAESDRVGAACRVRLDPQVPSSSQPAQSLDASGERDALDVVDARQRCPVTVLVQPPHLTLEVDTPALNVIAGESQGAKRNSDLRIPPGLRDARLNVPDGIPVRVVLAPLVRHLRVPLRARWIGRELIPVSLVVKGIQNDAERVVVAGVEILLQVIDDDPRRLLVSRKYGEVQRLIVIEHANFGVVRRGHAFPRFVLNEAGRDRCIAPRRFVECAIDDDGTGGPDGGQPPLQTCSGIVDGR